MHEVYDHNPGDHDDPLAGPTWIIGILGAVLLGIVILGVTALFFNADERMVADKTQTATYPQFETLKAEQLAKLEGPPRKVEINENDRVVESVVIPIDLAMQKIAERAAAVPSTTLAPSAGAASTSGTP